MRGVWSVYRLDTGELTGERISGTRQFAEANLPPGCGLLAGLADHRTQCVVDGVAQTHRPEPPTALHEWIDGAWQLPQAIVARRLQHRLEALDAKAMRSVAELVADPHDTTARSVLDGILAEKGRIRNQLKGHSK